MAKQINLDIVEVARPCPADWNAMAGDHQVRFCEQCSLHVYNISEMDRRAAQQLIADREGHLCVRMYKRVDGTLITADCGGGWRGTMKRAHGWMSAAVSAMALVIAALTGCEPPHPSPSTTMMGGLSGSHSQSQIDEANARAETANRQLQAEINTGTDCRVLTGAIAPLPATLPTTQK